MEEAMYSRLVTMKKRLEEINKELESSEVFNDISYFTKISKEKAQLEPVIEIFDKYCRAENDRKRNLSSLSP